MRSPVAASTTGSATQRVRRAVRTRVAVDLRALAAVRVALGAVVLLDLALRARSLVAFYTDAGVLPRATLAEIYPLVSRLSLHGLSGDARFQALLFVVAGVAGLALLVGYRTRFAVAVSLLVLLSLHARNPLVLNAGDSLLRQLLFWALFLPLGERWSVDARRTTGDRATRVASLASAALLAQVVVVYLVNAGIKLRGGRWVEGGALRYVFDLDRFTILLGDAIAGTPWLLGLLERVWLAMLAGSWLLVVLRGYPRAVLAGLFVLAHLGMALTLSLGIFPLVSMAALVAFLPTPVWDAVESRVAEPLAARLAEPVDRTESAGPGGDGSRRLPPGLGRWGGRLATVVVAAGLVVMVGYNAATVTASFSDASERGLDLGEPRWRMFAPNPPSTDGWYVVPGETADGETVDALHGGRATFDRPPDLAAAYPSARWHKYLTRLRGRGGPALTRGFADHLCWRWRDRRLRSVEVFFVAEPTNPGGPDPRERRRLGAFSCPPVSPT